MSRVNPTQQQLFTVLVPCPAYTDNGIPAGTSDSVEGQDDVSVTLPRNCTRIMCAAGTPLPLQGSTDLPMGVASIMSLTINPATDNVSLTLDLTGAGAGGWIVPEAWRGESIILRIGTLWYVMNVWQLATQGLVVNAGFIGCLLTGTYTEPE